MRDAGLRVSSLCRGGFFTAADPAEQRAGATTTTGARSTRRPRSAPPCLVLVPGGLPDGDRDLVGARGARPPRRSRRWCRTRSSAASGSAIEPMHPIFAADRGVVSTLAQALDIAEPLPAEAVGVVVDTFHVWWEPGVEEQIARAGDRIASYQVCEWITPLPPDALLSRGMMGDGHIDFAPPHRAAWPPPATAATSRWRSSTPTCGRADGDAVLATLARRYVELVEPHLYRGSPVRTSTHSEGT